jgi:hypothetical protein
MTREVAMALEPSAPRQLGEDGLVIFLREGREPGRREGLACILSVCPHPECPCQLVNVDGFVIDEPATAVSWDREGVHLVWPAGHEPARAALDSKMIAIVDPKSGETSAHPDLLDATDPAVLDWLASQMDGELLDVLHRFMAHAKGYPLERRRTDIDLDVVEDEPHAEDGIAVAEEEARDMRKREGLAELVRGPLRSRVLGDAEVEELAAPVVDDQEPVEDLEGGRGDGREVDGLQRTRRSRPGSWKGVALLCAPAASEPAYSSGRARAPSAASCPAIWRDAGRSTACAPRSPWDRLRSRPLVWIFVAALCEVLDVSPYPGRICNR